MSKKLSKSLVINETCHNDCMMCPISRHGRHFVKGEQSISDVLRSVDVVKDLAIKKGVDQVAVNLSGGEPLLHSQFEDIFYSIQESLDNFPAEVQIGLNSTLNFEVGFLKRKLSSKFFRSLNLSIHGAQSTHDKYLRRKGAFDRALKGLVWMKEYGKIENVHLTTCILRKTLSKSYLKLLEFLISEKFVTAISLINPFKRVPDLESLSIFLEPLEFKKRVSRFLFEFSDIVFKSNPKVEVYFQGFMPCFLEGRALKLPFLVIEPPESFGSVVADKNYVCSIEDGFIAECRECPSIQVCCVTDDLKIYLENERTKSQVEKLVKEYISNPFLIMR